tara:strand:- start:28786 stop:29871 length:1086 start_codon:yes stop_codon:yes gene_type:complete
MKEYNIGVIKEDCRILAQNVDISNFKDKKILIVGANGLIGGFLADFCCFLNDSFSANIEVVLTSYSAKNSANRVKHLLKRQDTRYFSWDCSLPANSDDIGEIDDVFFCAGYGQPGKFLKDAVKTTLINIVGVNSLLEHMQKNGGGNFMFLSSSEVYGSPDNKNIPTPEDYVGLSLPENNRDCYIQSKKTGELLCRLYNQEKNMNVKVARVALTYGPGVFRDDQRALQNFIFKAEKNNSINLLDQGNSIRNYLYITNSAEILINILYNGSNDVYNVGGDTEEITILQLAKKIGKIVNVKVTTPKEGNDISKHIVFAPTRVALDMTRYRKEFSSYQKNIVSLDQGLKKLINWFNIEAHENKIH